MGKIVFEEDAEIVIPESEKKVVDDSDIFDNSSDDEAPEAISTSTAKESSINKAKAEKEALAKIAALEKEKRRQRDQLLKEQKQGSKKQLKKSKEQVVEEEQEEEEVEEEEEEEESKRLPENLLQQALAEEEEDKKRKHVTEEDFERMLAEQEAEEKAKAKKRKTAGAGKQVGEYTVKVLNQRPKLQKADKNILHMRKQHLQRKAVPRKEAITNASSGRDGAALVFRRK